jgi:hypothetical protein
MRCVISPANVLGGGMNGDVSDVQRALDAKKALGTFTRSGRRPGKGIN